MTKAAIHVFSDASWNRKTGEFAGAFAIDLGSKPVGLALPPFCRTSTQAEILTTIAAIYFARQWSDAPILAHTDLDCIGVMLSQQKLPEARDLHKALVRFDARICPDAQRFQEYHRCHLHARWMAGIYGTKHPGFSSAG